MAIPTGKHSDWPWPLSLIPRGWNAWESDVPPVKIAGNVPWHKHLDVPARGQWAIAGYERVKIPVFFAFQTKRGRYMRLALIRYDYVDGYYTFFSFAYRHYRYAD